jgi:hypothetical protein
VGRNRDQVGPSHNCLIVNGVDYGPVRGVSTGGLTPPSPGGHGQAEHSLDQVSEAPRGAVRW